VLSIKQVLLAEKKKEYRQFVRTPFHTPWFARYSVLVHLLGVLSGGTEPLYTKPFFMFIYDLSILLTSTAFVDTKAKLRARRGEIYGFLAADFKRSTSASYRGSVRKIATSSSVVIQSRKDCE